MTLQNYKDQISNALYFGPFSDEDGSPNPEKAVTLIRMAEMELASAEVASLYLYYTRCCFENSMKYGEENRDYYEKATVMFRKMIEIVDRQEDDRLFKELYPLVEETVNMAAQCEGYASGYDDWLSDQWWRCRWYEEED